MVRFPVGFVPAYGGWRTEGKVGHYSSLWDKPGLR
jgi:hypothetical protein